MLLPGTSFIRAYRSIYRSIPILYVTLCRSPLCLNCSARIYRTHQQPSNTLQPIRIFKLSYSLHTPTIMPRLNLCHLGTVWGPVLKGTPKLPTNGIMKWATYPSCVRDKYPSRLLDSTLSQCQFCTRVHKFEYMVSNLPLLQTSATSIPMLSLIHPYNACGVLYYHREPTCAYTFLLHNVLNAEHTFPPHDRECLGWMSAPRELRLVSIGFINNNSSVVPPSDPQPHSLGRQC